MQCNLRSIAVGAVEAVIVVWLRAAVRPAPRAPRDDRRRPAQAAAPAACPPAPRRRRLMNSSGHETHFRENVKLWYWTLDLGVLVGWYLYVGTC